MQEGHTPCAHFNLNIRLQGHGIMACLSSWLCYDICSDMKGDGQAGRGDGLHAANYRLSHLYQRA
jgi:hypothetical protein